MTTSAEYFARRLAAETDPSDVHAALTSVQPGFVLVDVRSREAWDQGHVPEALHCPRAEVSRRGPGLVPPGATVVVYCWGPGCNGATKAALEFARLGVPVKEMIGGFEWWVREGLPVRRPDRVYREPPDPLTAVTD